MTPKHERFIKLAAGMQKAIDHAKRPMTQNPTPKRCREYRTRLHNAGNLERTQLALICLGEASKAGTLPIELAHLDSKASIAPLVYKGLLHQGYYDVATDPEYRDTSTAGQLLQNMLTIFRPVSAAELKAALVVQLEEQLRFQRIEGFYPTPAPVIARLLELADIRPGHSVLEPSAGKGDIADAIRAAHPDALLTCIELRDSLRTILEAKGHSLSETCDFIALIPDAAGLDRIVMNPPFERGQDIEHVRHAYAVLKPGGRLVSVMSAGTFSRQDRKAVDFVDWLGDEVECHVEALPDDAFQAAFCPAGVRSKIVMIDKPA